jgi:hypothetical protein
MTPAPDAQQKTIDLLKKALQADSRYLDACVQLADLYGRQHLYQQAVQYYDQANAIDSAYMMPAYLKYAKAEAGTGDFDRALPGGPLPGAPWPGPVFPPKCIGVANPFYLWGSQCPGAYPFQSREPGGQH